MGRKAAAIEERCKVTDVASTDVRASQHDAYCPHCFLQVEAEVEGDWPPEPARCPHCRLLIGPGRARPTAAAKPGARGTAAGVFAHQAKRHDENGDSETASPDAVCTAIRTVAEEVGARPERLLMVDYQQRAAANPELPDLSDVFAAFGSWKRARREAAA
jgi:hypothetical protein